MTQEKNEKESIIREIAEIKQQLADSDHRILKSYECFIYGEPEPYNMKALIASRRNKRGSIRYLKSLLQQINDHNSNN